MFQAEQAEPSCFVSIAFPFLSTGDVSLLHLSIYNLIPSYGITCIPWYYFVIRFLAMLFFRIMLPVHTMALLLTSFRLHPHGGCPCLKLVVGVANPHSGLPPPSYCPCRAHLKDRREVGTYFPPKTCYPVDVHPSGTRFAPTRINDLATPH